MIHLTIGMPGSGKSLRSAKKLQWLLKRNKRIWKKYKIKRLVSTNLPLHDEFKEKNKEWLHIWNDFNEVIYKEDMDIIIDEVARFYDARDWASLPYDWKTFLQEHDKMGNIIYANTQVPQQIDVAFRRLCEQIEWIYKLFGSRRPSHTKPPIKRIWGAIWILPIDKTSFEKEAHEMKIERSFLWWIPHLNIIDWYTCKKVFKTRDRIFRSNLPQLHHYLQYCEDVNCKLHEIPKVVHL